VYIVIIQL